MPPKMRTEEENVKMAIDITRSYIRALLRSDPDELTIRISDIRRRLNKSSYECYTMIAVAELIKEGLIKTTPEAMHTLVYVVRGGDGGA